MNIFLTPETQKLLEEQMKKHGYSSPEDTVRVALEKMDQEPGESVEDLPSEAQAAIDEALAQAARGEGRPWEEVRAELRDRFIKH